MVTRQEEIFKQAKESLNDCQPWPTHFKLRKIEYDLFAAFTTAKKDALILEIGCGNAFVSALYSDGAKLVVGCDLPDVDRRVHSMGLEKAMKLAKVLQIPNLSLAGCSATLLPFKENSVDIAVTLYALEHIADREKALREINRVLKNDGMCIVAVPNFMERFYSVIPYYFFLIRGGIQFIWKFLRYCFFQKKGNVSGNKQMEACKSGNILEMSLKQTINKFLRNKMYFPMPHGEYRTWFNELLAHFPSNWNKMLLHNGLCPIRVFSTILIPLPFIQIFSYQFAAWLYEKSSWVTRRIGGMPLIRSLGFNVVFVTRKFLVKRDK